MNVYSRGTEHLAFGDAEVAEMEAVKRMGTRDKKGKKT